MFASFDFRTGLLDVVLVIGSGGRLDNCPQSNHTQRVKGTALVEVDKKVILRGTDSSLKRERGNSPGSTFETTRRAEK